MFVFPSYGGSRGDLTFYRVDCPACGRSEDDLGEDGTKRSATAMWNRLRRREQGTIGSQSNPVPSTEEKG